MKTTYVVQVVIARPIDRLFTYRVPHVFCESIDIGDLVLVPFGKKDLIGCVLSFMTLDLLASNAKVPTVDKLRSIHVHLSHLPSFPKPLLQLMRQMSTYYHSTLGDIFKVMLPYVSMQKRYLINHDAIHQAIPDDTLIRSIAHSIQYDPFTLDQFPIYISKQEWKTWDHKGYYDRYQMPDFKTKIYQLTVKRSPQVKKSKKLSILCHLYISEYQPILYQDLLTHFADRKKGSIKKALRELFDADVLQMTLLPVSHLPNIARTQDRQLPSVILNEEQTDAFHHMKQQTGYQCYLLHGVTGSGKTEVYLSMIEHVLAQGKHVLVLIPEIGLTPQTMRRFKERLPVQVLPWHSQLTPQEKFKIWSELQQQEPCVLLGARSALFAPLSPLGLIVVDESHDTSYKQGDGVRYHARDMAVSRAYFEQCPIILGSATPSLESIYNVQQNKYQLLTLKKRAQGAILPKVHIVDLKQQHVVSPQNPAFSYPLLNAIKKRIERGEQSILFLNRRGFSQSVRCIACGFIFKCIHCEVTMPWHKQTQKLHCHYCDFKAPIPQVCPMCHQQECYAPIGKGTERLEDQIHEVFPQARLLRLDRDTQLDPLAFENLMRSGEVDVLIGTQMVTKGHDFPKVTLVGVIDADAALDLPDFRAAERTYQLLSQVAGRAGRADLQGEVIIQTYRPNEPLLQAALTHDFDSFCTHEMQLRSLISYPPFHYAAVIRIESIRFDLLQSLIQHIQNYQVTSPQVRMRGPNLAPIQKVRGRQRWMLLLLSMTRTPLHQEITILRKKYDLYSDTHVKINIDIDPIDFL